MASKLKTDILETVSGSGTIALTNQLSGMTMASVPSGSVIQVKSYTGGGATSTSSTWIDTGVGGSITPSSTSSKILATAHVGGCGTTGHASAHLALQIVRDSTSIHFFEGQAGYNASASANSIGACSGIKLDSPSTTSAVNYKIQMKNNGGSNGQVFTAGTSAVSSITLMEIKG